jgi:hypothetical protein
MQRCKMVTWIVFLSIVNFALGAPAAVRERLEMSFGVDVAEGGTATSQKRFDPLDDWSTTNAADRPPTSPIPIPTDQSWEEVADPGIDWYIPPTPESPGSIGSVDSNSPNYAPSNPESPTGSHPGLAGGSPQAVPPVPHPGPSEGRFPSTPGGASGFSVNAESDALLSTGHQPSPMPPQSPTGGSPLPTVPHPGPSEEGHFPITPGWSANTGTSLRSTGHQPAPPQSPTGDSPPPPLPHPGPSQDRSPGSPGSSANPDRFLDDLLQGKIKRRISGSGTVNAQRDPT